MSWRGLCVWRTAPGLERPCFTNPLRLWQSGHGTVRVSAVDDAVALWFPFEIHARCPAESARNVMLSGCLPRQQEHSLANNVRMVPGWVFSSLGLCGQSCAPPSWPETLSVQVDHLRLCCVQVRGRVAPALVVDHSDLETASFSLFFRRSNPVCLYVKRCVKSAGLVTSV